MRGNERRGKCAVCETYVPVYPKPRYGSDQVFPRAHKHPWRKTDTGWPAVCEGVDYPVTALAGAS